MKYSVDQIAKLLGGTVEGDHSVVLSDFGNINTATEGALTFLSNMKYEPYIYTTQASAVLVATDFTPTRPIQTTLIRVANPYESLAQLLQLYAAQQTVTYTGVHPTAIVDESVQIPTECTIGAYSVIEAGVTLGEQVVIQSHCVIGQNCRIGAGCTLHPRVTLYSDTIIGERCRIHSGSVIGADGFGFAPTDHGYDKIPQLGHVEIGDDVEIGANSCIDRATMGVTRVASGVKVDNLVQIAHNCTVGEHTVLAAQVGLAGSSHIEEWCQLGGQVGIAGHLSVGHHSRLGGQTGVLGNIDPHSVVMGAPAMPVGKALRAFAVLPQLPDMIRRVEKLEKSNTEHS